MDARRITRCPGCTTVFRITAQQLAFREGQVRCGHCRAVFDANDHLFDAAHVPDLTTGVRIGDVAASAEPASAEPASADPASAEPASAETVTEAELPATPLSPPDAESLGAPTGAPPGIAGSLPPGRFEWNPGAAGGRQVATYGSAVALLVALLALQAVAEFRDSLGVHLPILRPVLVQICRLFTCTVSAPLDSASLSIDASDLQADPAHRGLLLLTATIRNRASHSIAYPYLELALTDSSDQVVVRRAFPPADYVGGTSDAAEGIVANGEKLVRLFIDASATSQSGYRLYLFYP